MFIVLNAREGLIPHNKNKVMKFQGNRKRNKSLPNDQPNMLLNSGNRNAASNQDENTYPKPITAVTYNSPSDPQLHPGATPASLAAPGRFPRDPSHCQSSCKTMLALSSWGWEHSLPVWAACWEHWGSHTLPSHPGQMQLHNCNHNICTLQSSRAPLLLVCWVHWGLRQLDIFHLLLNV